jgi:CheY-like chemotaxis protein
MKQRTAFLIDDDSDDLEFMRDALRRLDPSIQYMSFVYPEEAINLLKELIVLPDYIFIDINMPKINGEDCLRLLRADQKFKTTPIILCSTSMPDDVSQKLLRAGANFTFAKPNTESGYNSLLEGVLSGDALKNLQ